MNSIQPAAWSGPEPAVPGDMHHQDIAMQTFNKVTLYTGPDGCARFREEPIRLESDNPQVLLSERLPVSAMQLRNSPVGFRSKQHVTASPQWVFILSGIMEITLLDGTSRRFHVGDHFYSADTLPAGQEFDAATHGHRSRQVGDSPLVTLFIRD